MLVIDSSAIVAILLGEPSARSLADRINAEADRDYRLAAPNYIEAGTVLAGRHAIRSQGVTLLDEFLMDIGIEVEPVDFAMARLALDARIRFGRGFGAAAGLNFGDSFAYALAKRFDAPLLFIGNDFGRTDIRVAL